LETTIDEINKTIVDIEKKILYFSKLKNYNKGKYEINFCDGKVSIDYIPSKEKIK
jgi:hypothetical protein